jgi:hypothetical protein
MTIALVLAACSGGANEARTTGNEEADPQTTEDEAPRPEIDPETACGRTLACCRAYAAAIPNVVEDSACAGVYEALVADDADARCQRMSAGWREALTHLSGEAPAVCE